MLGRMLMKEIGHRKVGFIICIISIAAAVGSVTGSILLLDSFDKRTEEVMEVFDSKTDELLAGYREQSQKAWDAYQDDVRKLGLNLGFNLLIIHEQQRLSNPDAEMKYLPQAYADKLVKEKLFEINHLVPFLQKKYRWKEQDRWITLVGTLGDVYIKNPRKQKSMFEQVEKGTAAVGADIWKGLKLSPGDKITIGGKEFKISRCVPPQDYTSDESIWIPLADAQQLHGVKDKITGIKAINCNCHTLNIAQLRDRIREVLADTIVFEHKTNKLVRAESRAGAARQARAALDRQEKGRLELRAERVGNRNQLRSERAAFSAMLVPLVTLIAAAWLGLLMWDNVRRRRSEIGILRAIGVGGAKIFILVQTRALIVGIIGSVLGIAAGFGISIYQATRQGDPVPQLEGMLAVVCTVSATLMVLLAGSPSAWLATWTDPAVVLREGDV